MRLSAYLSLSRPGVFLFQWSLPRTDHNCRPTIRISLRTRCPERAGTLVRYFASCDKITRDNKELARLRQEKLRVLVRFFFQGQLDQYLEWISNCGLSSNALEDARAEMLDHQDHLDTQRFTPMYLPIERFKRKSHLSDEDWFDSLPSAIPELRKGHRDMLRRVLEAAESPDRHTYGEQPAAPIALPVPASSNLGSTINDVIAEHSRQRPEMTTKQVLAYAGILTEHFGVERPRDTL